MAERRFAPTRPYSQQVQLPQRKTSLAAGYDLAAAETTTLPPGQVVLVPTGLKVYMPASEVLLVTVRSSLAVKQSIMLANGVGVIDADYVDNPQNEGHIMVPLVHFGPGPVTIAKGERIAQGLFVEYRTVTGDAPGGARLGGFGSTDS